MKKKTLGTGKIFPYRQFSSLLFNNVWFSTRHHHDFFHLRQDSVIYSSRFHRFYYVNLNVPVMDKAIKRLRNSRTSSSFGTAVHAVPVVFDFKHLLHFKVINSWDKKYMQPKSL